MKTFLVLCFMVSTIQSFDTFSFFNLVNNATTEAVSLHFLGGLITINDHILVAEASKYIGIMGFIAVAFWIVTMLMYVQYYKTRNQKTKNK